MGWDSHAAFLARGLLMIGLVRGVDMGQRPKDSSKEAVAVLKPLAIFSVYTFATELGAKEKK